MAAITWKNIDTPSNRDVSLALAAASQTMNGGFDALRGVLKDYQTGEEALWKKQDAEFTQRQLAKMYAAKTPEEFAALQASGEMAMAQAPNGARADMGLINQTMDARPGVIQTREQANWAFDNALRNKTEAPLVGQAQALIYAGNFEEAAKIIPQLSPQNQAVLQNAYQQFQQVGAERKMAEQRAAAELTRWDVQNKNDTTNTQSQATQAGASVTSSEAALRNAKANEARVILDDRLRQEALAAKTQEKETERNKSEGGINTAAGQSYVVKQINDSTKDEATRAKLYSAFSGILGNKDYSGAKASDVAAALIGDISQGTDFRKWFWDGTGDGALDNLKKIQKQRDAASILGAVPSNTASGTPIPGAESKPGTTVPNAFASSPKEAQTFITALTKGKNSGESAAAAPTMSPELRAEYEQQTLEMDPKIKLRKEYSPEIKTFFEKDAAAKKAADTALFEKRMAAAKEAGLTPPPAPGTFLKEIQGTFGGMFMDSQALNAAIANEQKKYNLFMDTIDKRIARTSK